MRKLFALFLVCATVSFAAITANTIWEVQPTIGVDTNGGGFQPGCGAKNITASVNLTIDGTVNTKVTDSGHNFVAADVGRWINITAGTNWTLGYYKIVSAASNAATLDRSPSAAGNANKATYDQYFGVEYTDVGATPHVNIDNSTITATTAGANSNVLTLSAGYTVASDDVCNVVHVNGGTNMNVGMYVITSVSGQAWTVSGAQNATTAGGAGSAITAKMGGSLATLAGISPTGGGYVASNHVFIKATGTLSVSAVTTISVGATPTNSVPFGVIEGYTTTRGDGGRATIQRSAGTSFQILTISGSGWRLRNLVVDGAAATGIGGVNFTGSFGSLTNSVVKGFLGVGVTAGAAGVEVQNNEITTSGASCTEAINATNSSMIRWNWIHDVPCPGIVFTSANTEIVHNLITNITGASSDCISGSVWNGSNIILSNTLFTCGRDGVRISAASSSVGLVIDNIIASVTGTGLNFSSAAGLPSTNMWKGNFYYNNGTNRANADDEGVTNVINGVSPSRASSAANADVLLTANPFTNTAGNDYSLNNTAGGGAAVKNAATPGAFLNAAGTTTTGFLSGGAVQPTVSSSCTGFATSYVQ
jgi:hypothetical protein